MNDSQGSRGSREEGGGVICLTPLYRFYPLYRHLDISRAITAESSPPRVQVANHKATRP